MWWDTRKISEPTKIMYLDPTKKQDPTKAHGAMCLDLHEEKKVRSKYKYAKIWKAENCINIWTSKRKKIKTQPEMGLQATT